MPQRNARPGLVFIVIFAVGLLVAYWSLNPESVGASVAAADQKPSFSPPRNVLPGPSGPYSLRTFQKGSVG
jgi:hypothetical protein